MGTPMERLLRVATLSVLVAACAGPRSAPRPPPPLLGKTVDVAAADLSGRELRVAGNGARLTVVDFWATWCEPCRAQLPALDRLAAKHGPSGVAVYAISFDDDRGAVERFVAEAPVSFPVLWDKGGETLAAPLELTRLPTTVVIDAAGVVRAVHLGFDDRSEAALDAEIRRLLER
jgi:thiol-disulfide isomerase/thioredoxin